MKPETLKRIIISVIVGLFFFIVNFPTVFHESSTQNNLYINFYQIPWIYPPPKIKIKEASPYSGAYYSVYFDFIWNSDMKSVSSEKVVNEYVRSYSGRSPSWLIAFFEFGFFFIITYLILKHKYKKKYSIHNE